MVETDRSHWRRILACHASLYHIPSSKLLSTLMPCHLPCYIFVHCLSHQISNLWLRYLDDNATTITFLHQLRCSNTRHIHFKATKWHIKICLGNCWSAELMYFTRKKNCTVDLPSPDITHYNLLSHLGSGEMEITI